MKAKTSLPVGERLRALTRTPVYANEATLSLGELCTPITNFIFHDLRHTFGTRLADAGVDVVKIKELMGHASIVTTMRYIHATDQGKRGAITVLSEYRQKRRHKSVTKRKAAGFSTCRKSLKIMVSRAGLEPATR
jgi:integrase